MLKKQDLVKFEKGEIHQQTIESSILTTRHRMNRLQLLVQQKKQLVFEVISGLKHVLVLLQQEGDQRSSEFDFGEGIDIAEIRFPEIIKVCSHMSLIIEKKLSFGLLYNEQDI